MKLLIIILISILSISGNAQNLQISKNGKHIENKDEKSFLWIGDTAWELFHRLNREEADLYLETRAKQGFTVIQAVVLAENDGLKTPNSYGDLPFFDLSPKKPNEKYFEHVDYIVNKANALGIYIAMLPTWGDKVFSMHPGAGPVVFNKENAEYYGRFLGERYKNKKIIWILGGDREIANLEVLNIWRAMAKGLKKGDNDNHLISFHPRGNSSSSYWLHNEEWLDFNMYQSGHGQHFNPVYNFTNRDLLKSPRKPTIEGEPAYEGIAVKFWEFMDLTQFGKKYEDIIDKDGLIKDKAFYSKGFFTDYDVRVHAYWDFLAGASGYTYGNNAVWQMFKKGGKYALACLNDWEDALHDKGAEQIIYMNHFFKSHPLSELVPDQSIVYGFNPAESHIQAAGNLNKTSILIYLAKGQPVDVVMKKIKTPILTAQWFDPRNGKTKYIGEFNNIGIQSFSPPSSGKDNDWLLVLTGK